MSVDSKESWDALTESRAGVVAVEPVFPVLEGAALFIRPCLARATLARSMRLNGVRTIAETDDNYFADKRYNLFARTYGTSEKIWDLHAKAMASMTANVFSTAWLRDRYFREYKRRFGTVGLPDPFVCRNHIPVAAWPTVPEYDGPVRVGFMGSPSHVWDVHIAYAAFHAAKHRGCETIMIGYDPSNPDPHIPDSYTTDDGVTYELRSKESLAVSRRWGKVIDRSVGWVAPEKYHRSYLPLDIGLCPLRRNDFTRGKSDVKAIEYVVSGAVPVLQRHPVYERSGWVHEQNCLFAKSQEDMAVQTLRLIDSPGLRAELLANAREYVWSERNENVMRDEWMAAING